MVELTDRRLLANGYPSRRRQPVTAVIGLLGVALASVLGLAAADQPLLAIGAGVGAILALAIAARPDFATIAGVAILYSNAAPIAVHLYGLPPAVGAVVPMLLAIPLVYYLIARREPLTATSALPFLVGLLIVQILSTLASSE